jgi:hypothetical protein
VRRRKGAGHGGAADARRARRGNNELGSSAAEATFSRPRLQAVYSGRRCLGFIMPRGKLGFEALDCDGRPLGIFDSVQAAAEAISAKEVAS